MNLAFRIVVLGLFLSFIAACSQGAGSAGTGAGAGTGTGSGAAAKPAGGSAVAAETAGGPVKAEISPEKGPVGLFFMTRFWPATGSLEKAAWYFSPDGEVYRNLQTGFSKEDLAAHQMKGKFKLNAGTLEVTWTDGKKTASKFEADTTGFSWDMGIFTPVKAFADASAVAGSYEGGESLSSGGNYAAVSKSLELKADGTFTMYGIGSIKGTTESSVVSADSQGGAKGTWKLDGYSIILTGSDGKTARQIAFPYDDEKTRRLYLGGTMYKRK